MDRAAAFLDDVLDSPDALRASFEAEVPAAALRLVRERAVVLTGMGSSRFAALEAVDHLRHAGVRAEVVLASVLDPAPFEPETTLVAVSSSGGTREVVAAARAWPGPVVAVTLAPDGPLVSEASAVAPLAGVRETAGIACHSYRATIATLVRLGVPDVEDRLEQAAAALDELIAGHAEWIGAAADALDGSREIHVIGSARRAGTLEQAALMLREAPRIPAVPFDTADWLHVGLYTMLPGSPALLYVGGPDDDEVIATIAGRGGTVVTVGEREDVASSVPLPRIAFDDDLVRSLVEPVVAELLAAELWSRTPPPG